MSETPLRLPTLRAAPAGRVTGRKGDLTLVRHALEYVSHSALCWDQLEPQLTCATPNAMIQGEESNARNGLPGHKRAGQMKSI